MNEYVEEKIQWASVIKKEENWIRLSVKIDGEIYLGDLILQNEEDAIRGAIEQQELIQEYREDKGKGFL